MAKSLISSPSSFIGTPLTSLTRHNNRLLSNRTKFISTRVKFSYNGIPPLSEGVNVDFAALVSRAESVLYTLADAAVVAVDGASGGGDTTAATTTTVQKAGGWFGFISDAMEVVLKVLKDGLSSVHVPYSYGFAIILLTVLVKLATLPLTKQQVESTLAMQNLQPKLKAIQQRYAGNQERIQLETGRLYKQAGVNPLAGCLPTLATIPVWIGLYQALSNVANEGLLTEGFFWIPSLGGPTTIAARQSGSGVSWLFPFVDGHPPLGWSDTAAYLVLPVLLVLSQYVSMEIMKPPQTDDPAQKNTLLVFKFLPLMIGYFSLSVPSGLSIYWFTNNVLSTAQQVWLRKLGGAKPAVNENAGGIISAGRAKRSSSQPSDSGARFKQLKEEEKRKAKALPEQDVQVLASSTSESEDETDDDTKSTEVLEEAYASSTTKPVVPGRSKRSKRKRSKIIILLDWKNLHLHIPSKGGVWKCTMKVIM
uniref:Inner membrane protein PPF-1, chloroplastic n=1 Tax=Tanacetum cinerariifolium TaxID=118510 RepID=A0A6L2L175_TANCI|nr:inner membrane protein PPF-1, chloroplastic [Tanacetum cinerariifolium]